MGKGKEGRDKKRKGERKVDWLTEEKSECHCESLPFPQIILWDEPLKRLLVTTLLSSFQNPCAAILYNLKITVNEIRERRQASSIADHF